MQTTKINKRSPTPQPPQQPPNLTISSLKYAQQFLWTKNSFGPSWIPKIIWTLLMSFIHQISPQTIDTHVWLIFGIETNGKSYNFANKLFCLQHFKRFRCCREEGNYWRRKSLNFIVEHDRTFNRSWRERITDEFFKGWDFWKVESVK